MFKEILQVKGHLIDSALLSEILNTIINEGADYEIRRFDVGKHSDETSFLEFEVSSESSKVLTTLLPKLIRMGCYEKQAQQALWREATQDKTAPSDFYSTTNHKTEVYWNEQWHPVSQQRMDAVVVSRGGKLQCLKIRDILKGDMVLCNSGSVRVFPPHLRGEEEHFGFMNAQVSSERSVDISARQIADLLQQIRSNKGTVVVVAGPVVIHTGGGPSLSWLIREGYIQGLLSGNALAVHDIESQLYQTSLGINLNTGEPEKVGHMHHMKAINSIYAHGSLKNMVKEGALTKGVMYELIQRDVPYCLAGSIRDDGPLPETEVDMIKAQKAYAEIIDGAEMVLMLSSMLHSIGTGNMLPSWVKTICVDINPAVVTKLSDRGSSQTIGIVADVGLFLRELVSFLQNPKV